MHKQISSKRKIRNRIFKTVPFIAIFFLTLTLLFSSYFWNIYTNHTLLSPISLAKSNQNFAANEINDFEKLTTLLEKSHVEVKDITTASDSATIVFLKSGQEIFFSPNKQLAQQIASLQLIMNRLTIEGRRFSRIDFRYDNPVVSF